jgi:hypothetical protein
MQPSDMNESRLALDFHWTSDRRIDRLLFSLLSLLLLWMKACHTSEKAVTHFQIILRALFLLCCPPHHWTRRNFDRPATKKKEKTVRFFLVVLGLKLDDRYRGKGIIWSVTPLFLKSSLVLSRISQMHQWCLNLCSFASIFTETTEKV